MAKKTDNAKNSTPPEDGINDLREIGKFKDEFLKIVSLEDLKKCVEQLKITPTHQQIDDIKSKVEAVEKKTEEGLVGLLSELRALNNDSLIKKSKILWNRKNHIEALEYLYKEVYGHSGQSESIIKKNTKKLASISTLKFMIFGLLVISLVFVVLVGIGTYRLIFIDRFYDVGLIFFGIGSLVFVIAYISLILHQARQK